MEVHFNSILDILSDWRGLLDKDIGLATAVDLAHKEYVSQESESPTCNSIRPNTTSNNTIRLIPNKSSQMFSKLELKLLEFHISNLEYACGANLSQVSALNWDQNEQFPQFQGEHTIMTHGFASILEKLAEGIKTRYSSPVEKIKDLENQVEVTIRSGEKIVADRCIVTVPLALMKKRAISFEPELERKKIGAIDRLGAGLIEKVALRFDKKWWNYKIGGRKI